MLCKLQRHWIIIKNNNYNEEHQIWFLLLKAHQTAPQISGELQWQQALEQAEN